MKSNDQIVRYQRFSLLELLDRLLDKGVVVKGEILLAVADIDLVYLNLGLLLSSVKTVEVAAKRGGSRNEEHISWPPAFQEEHLDTSPPQVIRGDGESTPVIEAASQRRSSDEALAIARALPPAIDKGLDQLFTPKANIDPKNVEKGLARLVLTLVELIRQLMEKQAIRRIEADQLHASEIERIGDTFLLLNEKMEQLKETFALKDEDLNIDLGPLGDLI